MYTKNAATSYTVLLRLIYLFNFFAQFGFCVQYTSSHVLPLPQIVWHFQAHENCVCSHAKNICWICKVLRDISDTDSAFRILKSLNDEQNDDATRNTRTYSFPMGCLISLTLGAFNKCHRYQPVSIHLMYLHVWTVDCVLFFIVFPLGAFWICRWLIFSSTLQCLLEKLALLIGLNDSLPMHSFSRNDWLYNPLDKGVSCNYSIIFRKIDGLSVYKCAVLIHFGWRLRLWVVFWIRDSFDIVIHRQIYRFIYRFLFLNQLTLGLSVWLWAMLTFQHIYIWVTFQICFIPFKNRFLVLLENVRMSFVSKCNAYNYTGHKHLHSFLNVLNAFGYKDSEFVAEMLMWDKRVRSYIKGWVVNDVGGVERLLCLIMLQH